MMARTGDAMDVGAFSSSKGASKGAGNGQDSEVVCWYCAGTSSFRLPQGTEGRRQRTTEGAKKGDDKGKDTKNELVQGQVLEVRQDWSHVERLQVQRIECIQSERKRLGGDPVHRHGEHRLERAGDRSGAIALESTRVRQWRCS